MINFFARFQNNPGQNKYLYSCAMIYLLLGLLSPTFSEKLIMISGINFAASAFVSAFWFLANDIIAEVYGYKVANKIFCSFLINALIFTSILYAVVHLKSDMLLKDNSYLAIWSHSLIGIINTIAALLISYKVNVYLITKWKILTKGKYFWLRSIGSSGIGEIIFSLILLLGWKIIGLYPLSGLIKKAVYYSTFRIMFTAICAIPFSLIAELLKQLEARETPYNLKKFVILNLNQLRT